MTYEEAQQHIDELGTRYNAPFSLADRQRIEALYPQILNKPFRATSCQRCYHDAYLEMALFLRKNRKMAEKSRYTMRAGFIIMCPAFHGGRVFTNANLTDEIAEEYLAMFPNQSKYFDIKPRVKPSNGTKTAANVVVKASKKKPVKRKKTEK